MEQEGTGGNPGTIAGVPGQRHAGDRLLLLLFPPAMPLLSLAGIGPDTQPTGLDPTVLGARGRRPASPCICELSPLLLAFLRAQRRPVLPTSPFPFSQAPNAGAQHLEASPWPLPWTPP